MSSFVNSLNEKLVNTSDFNLQELYRLL